ncbi:hypothetical protein IF1G_08309 [Cordyceps javanica]|uniref:Uncharacterized protein n=1 Tax=Cordyceps javanica TaxID=43265 RepID=A0A545UU71_9HYPO|nr:hypothetical protein IF1G_08309 [Cordyceps javanica]
MVWLRQYARGRDKLDGWSTRQQPGARQLAGRKELIALCASHAPAGFIRRGCWLRGSILARHSGHLRFAAEPLTPTLACAWNRNDQHESLVECLG